MESIISSTFIHINAINNIVSILLETQFSKFKEEVKEKIDTFGQLDDLLH